MRHAAQEYVTQKRAVSGTDPELYVKQTIRAVSETCGKGTRHTNNQRCLCDMWQRFKAHKQPELSLQHVAKVQGTQTTRAVSVTCGKDTCHTNNQSCLCDMWQRFMSHIQTTRAVSVTCGKGTRHTNKQPELSL